MSPLREALQAWLLRVGEEAAARVQDGIKYQLPKTGGPLEAGIGADVGGGWPELQITFRSDAPYSSFVDEGTRPHEIHGPLSFFWDKIGAQVIVPASPLPGGPAFFRNDGTLIIGKGYVNHPGTIAYDFFVKNIPDLLEPAFADAMSSVQL